MLDLTGAVAKLDRAKAHRDDLARLLASVFNPDRQRFVLHSDPETGQHVLWVYGVPRVDPTWSLIAGDCLQNVNAALDHVAYALVREFSSKPPNAATYFPGARTSLGQERQGPAAACPRGLER